MTRRRFAGWEMPPDEPTPLSMKDARELARMTAIAFVAVVVGILLAPYLWAWLS